MNEVFQELNLKTTGEILYKALSLIVDWNNTCLEKKGGILKDAKLFM